MFRLGIQASSTKMGFASALSLSEPTRQHPEQISDQMSYTWQEMQAEADLEVPIRKRAGASLPTHGTRRWREDIETTVADQRSEKWLKSNGIEPPQVSLCSPRQRYAQFSISSTTSHRHSKDNDCCSVRAQNLLWEGRPLQGPQAITWWPALSLRYRWHVWL